MHPRVSLPWWPYPTPSSLRSKDTFERGQMDEFKVQCRNLGNLRALRVISDGRR